MEFRSTATLEETLDVLSELGDDAQILAGGTDVMVQLQRHELDPGTLVHVERLEGLRRAEERDGTLALGALVTHRRVATDPSLSSQLPALAEAAATVGGWQTQEVGTVAGNLCNASPAADTLPPLLVADATVELASAGRDARRVPVEAFLLGRRHTDRRPDELVTWLGLEPVGDRTGEVYLKVGPRSGMEVALVGLAVRLSLAGDDTVADARVAACSVAPVPFRAVEAERILLGSRLEEDAIREAGEALTAAADPIDDQRATARYRRRVLGPLLGRAVGICEQRAGGA